MKKPRFDGAKPVAGAGITNVSGGVFIFIGGLYEDTGGLGKVLPFIRAVFSPLIKVAVEAYTKW